MEPRYQCVALGPVWSWRLLGSNHRELARSASRFGTLEEATADAVTTASQASTATIDIALTPGTSWHWVMSVDGEPRAASVAGYARRLECSRAVERFRESAPIAPVSPTPLVHRRLGSRPQHAGPESWRDDQPCIADPTRRPNPP
jgi:hypothetical protein